MYVHTHAHTCVHTCTHKYTYDKCMYVNTLIYIGILRPFLSIGHKAVEQTKCAYPSLTLSVRRSKAHPYTALRQALPMLTPEGSLMRQRPCDNIPWYGMLHVAFMYMAWPGLAWPGKAWHTLSHDIPRLIPRPYPA